MKPDASNASVRDRRLVEWVAQASVGDDFPVEYRYAHSPLESIVLTLTQLGVMDRPAPGTGMAEIAGQATAAARAWLEAHPAPTPAPAPAVRRPPWVKPGS